MEASLYRKKGRRQPEFALAARQGQAADDLVSPQIFLGGLGFSCGGVGCVCNGDDDCNDMFSTNVCGPNAACFVSRGQVVCVCLRF